MSGWLEARDIGVSSCQPHGNCQPSFGCMHLLHDVRLHPRDVSIGTMDLLARS